MQKRSLLITVLLFASAAMAYGQMDFGILYSVNFPLSDTKDFIEKTSFRGASFEFRNFVKPNVSVGGVVGWYTFYERKDLDTYTSSDDALSISGVQYRYVNSVPLLAMVDYHFTPGESFSPFAGLGIGTTYNRVDSDMGLYEITIDTWHFTLAPQVGFKAGSPDIGMWGFMAARYNYNFSTSELDTQSYLTLSVGFLLEL